MCLVRAWRMGLCDRRTTLRLTHRSVGGKKVTPSSLSKDSSHQIFELVWAKALYSASVLEHATSGYFFELRVIRFMPTKMHDPDVNFVIFRITCPVRVIVASHGEFAYSGGRRDQEAILNHAIEVPQYLFYSRLMRLQRWSYELAYFLYPESGVWPCKCDILKCVIHWSIMMRFTEIGGTIPT